MADGAKPRKIGAGVAQAAMRQGAKEIGTMLKAFPESVSVDEPGTLFNPTQGEIAEANRSGTLSDRVREGRGRAAEREPPQPEPERE